MKIPRQEGWESRSLATSLQSELDSRTTTLFTADGGIEDESPGILVATETRAGRWKKRSFRKVEGHKATDSLAATRAGERQGGIARGK